MIAGGSDGTAATIVRGRASGYRRDPQAAGRWGRGRAPARAIPRKAGHRRTQSDAHGRKGHFGSMVAP
jgi:hypothetical protein